MKRIGVAASKISKGNMALYNFYVVLISFLCSSFVFVIAGSTVVFALVLIGYLSNEFMTFEPGKGWFSILSICMITLTVLITFFNLVALSINLKFRRNKLGLKNGK